MAQPATFTKTQVFYVETCFKCGIEFGVAEPFQAQLRRNGAWFFCPNGHQQHYSETEADRIRKEVAAAKRDADWQRQRREQTERDRDAVQRRLSAQFGENTKLRKRIGNGACPCCKRSFPNLAAHMKTKHPDFKEPIRQL